MQDEQPNDEPTTIGLTRGRTGPEPPRVPDHELLRCIGSGSFGEVWLARNVMGTYRAVKIIYRSTFSDERPYEREFHGLERFEPVSRSHDGFVDILQAGRNDAEGYFFYVMEVADDIVSGQTFDPATYAPKTLGKEAADRGRIPARECVALGVSLSAALAHLHQHGLLHRDIKPSNIIFVNGIPKLADIGLVAGVETLRSFPGGTEGFIPPEGPGAVQADIYALGKVLYEIATGHDRHAFPDLPTQLDQAPDQERFLELNEVVLKACERELDKRYKTAEEMHADLLLLQTGKSVKRLRLLEKRVALLTRMGLITAVGLIALGGIFYVTDRQFKTAAQLKQQQVFRNVAQGTRFLDERDFFRSLPPFIEALNLERSDLRRQETHRVRIGAVLRQCPRIVQMCFPSGYINKADLSPDGRYVITGGKDGTATLCDLNGNGESLPWFKHSKELEGISFSPDGRLVLTAGDGFVEIREIGATNPVRSAAPPETVYSAKFSPDGSQFVTASGGWTEGYVWIYDTIGDGRGREFLRSTNGAYRCAAFSPDGKFLVTACEDKTAQVWDLATASRVGLPIRHTDWVYYAAFSPDGLRIVTASLDFKAAIADAKTGRPIFRLTHPAGVACAQFSPDGRYVVTAGWDHTVRIWDAFTGDMLFPTLKQSGKHVVHVAFTPDSRRVLGVNANGVVYLWDLAPIGWTPPVGRMVSNPAGDRLLTIQTNGPPLLETPGPGPGRPVKLSAQLDVRDAALNGSWLVALSEQLPTENSNTLAQLCDATTGEARSPSFSLGAKVTAAVLSGNGKRLAVLSGTNAAVWDTSGKLLFSLPHPGKATGAYFSADNAWLATTSESTAAVWDAHNGKQRRLLAHQDFVSHAAFSPDSQFLLTSCNSSGTFVECSAEIWAIATGRPARPPLKHGDGVTFAAFSWNGKRLLTASEDNTARVWETLKPEPVLPPLQHAAEVAEAQFSRDDRWIVTACEKDRTARVWDGATGEPLTPPLKHPWEFVHAQFVGGRRAILTRRSKGESMIWELPPDPRPINDLARLAELLSGHTRDSTGAVLPLTRAALRVGWEQLRLKYPGDFAVSNTEVADWHRRQAQASEQAAQWQAAVFHWNRVLQTAPAEPPQHLHAAQAESKRRR